MLPNDARIYVATTPIDMRRSFDGLAAAVSERMKHDPQSGSLFVFANASRRCMKGLWLEATGYALLYKRLDRGVFRLPDNGDIASGSIDINAQELMAILSGIELPTNRTSARKIVHEARAQAWHVRDPIQHNRAR